MRPNPRFSVWILLLLCALLPGAAVGAAGQAAERRERPCAQPWVVGNPEGNYIVPGAVGDVAYRTVGGRRLALDAYVPPGRGPHPAVILIHGGRWKSGSRVSYVTQLFEPLARAGIAWFSIDYRLGPNPPDAAQQASAVADAAQQPAARAAASQEASAVADAAQNDLAEAARFIRCHASRLRVDPARVALIGEDTGAQMAVLEAAARPEQYRGVAALGGVFPEHAALRQALSRPKGLPPMLVIHGAADRDVPPAEAMHFCDDVRIGGGTKSAPLGACQYYTVEGASHRFENWWPTQWHYKAELVRWLRERLGLPRLEITDITALLRAPFPQPSQTSGLRKNIEYAPGLKLDAYVPRRSGLFPAVIIAHGGGWEAGDKVTYVAPLFEPLAKAGFAWFSIDYRLTPAVRHPAQLDDLRRAIRYVRHHAARFRVDPRRIAILGESASAQMAALVASLPCPPVADSADPVDRTDCRPNAVVSFYGVYDFVPRVTDASPRSLLVRLFGPRELDDASRTLLREYSPITHARRDLPPALLLQGTDESLYELAVEYAGRLKQVGARHELYLLKGAPHGLENWEGRPEWQGYKRKLVEWLLTETSAAKAQISQGR